MLAFLLSHPALFLHASSPFPPWSPSPPSLGKKSKSIRDRYRLPELVFLVVLRCDGLRLRLIEAKPHPARVCRCLAT
ncbi:hypothetical protein BCV70DRAFT_203178 [Testicularia cyperi]|uniref:Secreted protein n=1 Tax=Testicularia cyperi TaxID=1882483 RepID=A0A317XHZ3_9BASI|nr:hypothetical protein BCV70DRAFT_203178 [Testicularia cyperi]